MLFVGIHWQQRIYNVAQPPMDPAEVLKYSTGRPIILDPFRFVRHIPINSWKELLQAFILDIDHEMTRVCNHYCNFIEYLLLLSVDGSIFDCLCLFFY